MDPNGFYSFDQNTLPQRAVTNAGSELGVQELSGGPLDPIFGLPASRPFNPSTLQQRAVANFSVPGGNAGSDQPFQELPDGPLDTLFGLPSYLSSNSNTLQQPANDAFAQNGAGLDFVHFESLNQTWESFNGPSLGLNNCQSMPFMGAPVTNQFESGPFNDSDMGFGPPYSFNQMTLPQGPAMDVFAPNASFSTPGLYSADRKAFDGTPFATGSIIDATLQSSESGTSPATLASSIMLSHPSPPLHAARPSGFSCDWPGCKSAEVFSDHITRSQHISTIHIQKVLQDGSDGTCKWPGCTKTKLDTIKKLQLHVTNIHVEPILCTIKPCKRTEPFGRKGELDRHIASFHKRGRTWKCPRKNCARLTKGFPRKDKLDSHIRARGHGTFPCQYSHCPFRENTPFMTQAELASHYDDHGNLECGINACKDKISAFSLRTLSSHLYFGHLYSDIDPFGHKAYNLDNVTQSVRRFVERSQGVALRVHEGDLGGLNFELGSCIECQ